MMSSRTVLGDGGYRGIATITGPRRGPDGRIIRDHPHRAHRPIHAASNMSPPGSKTGKSFDSADIAAKPSTTPSTSSPDPGSYRAADNYGSPPRQRVRPECGH